uniref:Uncharacterized protein n=1 Tax=Trichuris muris TaxID=70415 RepID=A0A5S6QQJ7_TRIMR
MDDEKRAIAGRHRKADGMEKQSAIQSAVDFGAPNWERKKQLQPPRSPTVLAICLPRRVDADLTARWAGRILVNRLSRRDRQTANGLLRRNCAGRAPTDCRSYFGRKRYKSLQSYCQRCAGLNSRAKKSERRSTAFAEPRRPSPGELALRVRCAETSAQAAADPATAAPWVRRRTTAIRHGHLQQGVRQIASCWQAAPGMQVNFEERKNCYAYPAITGAGSIVTNGG